MEKFTKGEWFKSIDGCVYAPTGGDCKKIAIIHANNIFQNDEEKANAHLVAVAPEMYRMLDTIETVLSGRSEYHPDEISVDYIRKLLVKARGEQ